MTKKVLNNHYLGYGAIALFKVAPFSKTAPGWSTCPSAPCLVYPVFQHTHIFTITFCFQTGQLMMTRLEVRLLVMMMVMMVIEVILSR